MDDTWSLPKADFRQLQSEVDESTGRLFHVLESLSVIGNDPTGKDLTRMVDRWETRWAKDGREPV